MHKLLSWVAAAAAIFLVAFLINAEQKANYPAERKEEMLENVVRIFWHGEKKFSFMLKAPVGTNPESPQTYTMKDKWGWSSELENVVIFIEDVPAGQLMRASKKWGGGQKRTLEIHIHAPEDIRGAGWDNGKLGSGATNVIAP